MVLVAGLGERDFWGAVIRIILNCKTIGGMIVEREMAGGILGKERYAVFRKRHLVIPIFRVIEVVKHIAGGKAGYRHLISAVGLHGGVGSNIYIHNITIGLEHTRAKGRLHRFILISFDSSYFRGVNIECREIAEGCLRIDFHHIANNAGSLGSVGAAEFSVSIHFGGALDIVERHFIKILLRRIDIIHIISHKPLQTGDIHRRLSFENIVREICLGVELRLLHFKYFRGRFFIEFCINSAKCTGTTDAYCNNCKKEFQLFHIDDGFIVLSAHRLRKLSWLSFRSPHPTA